MKGLRGRLAAMVNAASQLLHSPFRTRAVDMVVPPLVLSDALLFASEEIKTEVLRSLEGDLKMWNDALVLTPQFWDPGPNTILLDRVLNEVIDTNKGIPALAAASIRFDPDRGIQIGNFDAAQVSLATCELLAVARNIRVFHSASLLQLLELMPELTCVAVAGCARFKELSLPAAPSLKSLQTLSLTACDSLTDISALASLQALETLNLKVCRKLVDIIPLASLPLLRELFISGCEKLTDISPLRTLSSLRSLTLLSFELLEDIGPLGSLRELRKLVLKHCPEIIDISVIGLLTSLQELDLKGCGKLSDISAIATLTELKILDLSGCWGLFDLTPLKSLAANLKKLNLSECD